MLVCGVGPLVDWLEGFSVLEAVPGAAPTPKNAFTRCSYIGIDLLCSLVAELGVALGVVSLRESPTSKGQPRPSQDLEEGQHNLVVTIFIS